MTDVTIFHNPACGTSRNTLAMIRNAGVEPRVVEYLKTPPSRLEVQAMVFAAGLTLRQALREKGTPFAELGLGEPGVTDAQMLDALEQHPILLNRPFVVTPLGTALCRPSERVLDLLTAEQRTAFAKEDGEQVVDAAGKRLK
jgi:arsenate reductase